MSNIICPFPFRNPSKTVQKSMGRTKNPELPDRLRPALHAAGQGSSTPAARRLGLLLCSAPVGGSLQGNQLLEGEPLIHGPVRNNRGQALPSPWPLLTGPSVATESTTGLLLDNRSWDPRRWARDLTKPELKPELRLLSHSGRSFLVRLSVCH